MGFWCGENPLSEVSAGAGKPPVTCACMHHVQRISPETRLSLCREESMNPVIHVTASMMLQTYFELLAPAFPVGGLPPKNGLSPSDLNVNKRNI